MLLNDLVTTIVALQERISQHRTDLSASETLTRYVLINPLLRALGSDLEDPSQVRPEYSGAGGGLADYALFDEGDSGKPAAILEAKSLDTTLSASVVNQTFQYCFQLGIGHIVITNGNHWRCFDLLTPGLAIERREINSVTLTNEPAHRLALKLLLLWRPNLASGQPVSANEPIFAAKQAATNPQPTNIQDPASVTPPPPSNEGWTSIVSLPPDVSWRSKPSRIRFPNGDEKTIQWNQWKRVLIEVAEWLIKESSLTGGQCPIGHRPGLYIIHSEPVHPTGNPFFHPSVLSNSLYLASAANAKRAASDCAYLMELCQQDPAKVHLKLS